jgi:hypothetical protein
MESEQYGQILIENRFPLQNFFIDFIAWNLLNVLIIQLLEYYLPEFHLL